MTLSTRHLPFRETQAASHLMEEPRGWKPSYSCLLLLSFRSWLRTHVFRKWKIVLDGWDVPGWLTDRVAYISRPKHVPLKKRGIGTQGSLSHLQREKTQDNRPAINGRGPRFHISKHLRLSHRDAFLAVYCIRCGPGPWPHTHPFNSKAVKCSFCSDNILLCAKGSE